MYKKQMVFQKIICIAVLVASALVFLYSLGLMTDLYDSLYMTMMDPEDLESTWVPGSIIYYEMQPFNSSLTKAGIGLILVSLVLFITNTHSRRRYYIGNFFAVALSTVGNVAVSVWMLKNIAVYRQQFLTIDFEAMKSFSEMWKTPYIDSTFWFDACYAVCGVLLVATALLVANMILKLIVMKEEKRMIGSRKDVKA